MEWEQIKEPLWDAVVLLILPALGTSMAVMLVVRWAGGRRFGVLATMLAVTAGIGVSGVYVVNNVSNEIPWQLEATRPLNRKDFCQVLAWSLEEKPKPAEVIAEPAGDVPVEDPPSINRLPIYWIPYLAALAMLAEFMLPLLVVPAGPAWAVRTLIAVLAGRMLTPNNLRMEHSWLSWALALAILLEWALLTSLARRWADGVVATGLGACCAMAGLVLTLVSCYPSAYDRALLFGAVLAGPALIAWIWPSDTSPAAAAAAVVLPGLLLDGHYFATFENPPLWSFVLAGLAPLALLPMWLPFLARRERWARWLPGLILPLIPAVLAVVWAVQAQPLPQPAEITSLPAIPNSPVLAHNSGNTTP